MTDLRTGTNSETKQLSINTTIMKTLALIERGRDGSFGIFTPDLECTISGSGQTLHEAKEDFANAYHEMIAAYTEDLHEAVPAELVDLEFDYKYDTASVLEEISAIINMAGLAKETGINAVLLRRYKKGEYISAMQAKRIEDGIHRIGMRMAALSLT